MFFIREMRMLIFRVFLLVISFRFYVENLEGGVELCGCQSIIFGGSFLESSSDFEVDRYRSRILFCDFGGREEEMFQIYILVLDQKMDKDIFLVIYKGQV